MDGLYVVLIWIVCLIPATIFAPIEVMCPDGRRPLRCPDRYKKHCNSMYCQVKEAVCNIDLCSTDCWPRFYFNGTRLSHTECGGFT